MIFAQLLVFSSRGHPRGKSVREVYILLGDRVYEYLLRIRVAAEDVGGVAYG